MIRGDTQPLKSKEGDGELLLKNVINTYTKILYNFIRRFGFTNEEAEDILQDIFIKVWKYRDSFDEEKSARKTWIFTITKNTIYDALRKKKNTKIISSIDEHDDSGNTQEIEDVSSDILTILEHAHNKNILIQSINTLPEDEKTILLLHFEEGMTFSEIAAIFEKPLNTIKSKYRRSLLKIKVLLETVHQNHK